MDKYGLSPLHYAAIDGEIDTLNEYDGDLTQKTKDGSTALHFAILNKRVEVVKLLVKKLKFEDRFIKNDVGESPLDLVDLSAPNCKDLDDYLPRNFWYCDKSEEIVAIVKGE